MRLAVLLYALGVLAGSCVGFFSPWWFLGFLPLSTGLVWAAYDLVEVPDGEPSPASQRTSPR
jgi:hypothetical protein